MKIYNNIYKCCVCVCQYLKQKLATVVCRMTRAGVWCCEAAAGNSLIKYKINGLINTTFLDWLFPCREQSESHRGEEACDAPWAVPFPSIRHCTIQNQTENGHWITAAEILQPTEDVSSNQKENTGAGGKLAEAKATGAIEGSQTAPVHLRTHASGQGAVSGISHARSVLSQNTSLSITCTVTCFIFMYE